MNSSWDSYLILDTAGVVDNSDTSGVGSNIQPLNDLCQEDLYLLKLRRANATAAVDDEHDVCGTSFAQTCRYTWRHRKDIIMINFLLVSITTTCAKKNPQIKLTDKGEKGEVGGAWEGRRYWVEKGGWRRWKLVRKWEETEIQDAGRREVRLEGEMEECLARKTRMKEREKSYKKPLKICLSSF